MLPALSLSSSPNPATVKVDKATSELLMAPDWTMNMEICDSVNSDNWMAKEVIKAVKRRLQSKNPRVQILTLTLLETLVKNCGDNIHFHIAERKVLDELIKIVKKRSDLQVRSKILALLDSWQEAFGGPGGGRHPQYYWAYDELRKSGVQFPQRSSATAPIITPPATQLAIGNPQYALGMSSNSTSGLDTAMPSGGETLNASGMESIRNAMELLSDMLQAANPNDRMSVKDEVIVDLVDRCRNHQRKLMEMLATTMDEALLGQGIELNDGLQALLAKHDAIASGSPLPVQLKSAPASVVTPNGSLPQDSGSSENVKPTKLPGDAMKGRAIEEEEEDDEFALIAKRHMRSSPAPDGTEDAASSSGSNSAAASATSSATPEPSLLNALVPVDPPEPTKSTKDQDMVDFLSIVLSTSFSPEPQPNPPTPTPAPATNHPQTLVEPPYSSYVVPWAQPEPPQPHPHPQQWQMQGQLPGQGQFSGQQSYPPPPWAPTPGYNTGRPMPTNPLPQETQTGPTHQTGPLPVSQTQTQTQMGNPPQSSGYVPSYRLFEDLNVFGNMEGKIKSGPYSSASNSSSKNMVGGGR